MITVEYNPKYFQDMVLILKSFWLKQGCAIIESYDHQVGAGTLAPYTALKISKKEPCIGFSDEVTPPGRLSYITSR